MAIFSANSISISVSNFISSSSHLSSFTPPTSFIKLAAHLHLQLLLNLRLRLQNSAIDGFIPSGIMLILPAMPALSSYIFQLYLCLHISCICYLQVAPATGIRLHLLPSLPSIPPVFSMKARSSHMHTSKSTRSRNAPLSCCFSTPLRQRGFSPLLSVFLSSALISLITIIMLCRIQYLPNLKGLQGRRWWCRVLQLPSRRLLWLLPLCGNQGDLPS